jgi:hypothetical protein
MVWIWFGLDSTGIEKSTGFHWLLGPVLMIMFTFLGNTLFLTILISMLSNTFSLIVRNAVQEIQYRRAVVCFMGVKSDALFSYWPPCNILACLTLLPLKLVISSRTFHKINVFCTRIINAPMLLVIAWYERRSLWTSSPRRSVRRPSRIDWANPNGPRAVQSRRWIDALSMIWDFSRYSVHGDMQAVFDIEPPQEVKDELVRQDQARQTVHGGAAQAMAAQFRRPSMWRRKSSKAATRPRRASATGEASPVRRRRSSAASHGKQKKPQFNIPDADQNEEDAEDGENGAPPGYWKPRRGERMDSIVDLDSTDGAMQEANVRLNRMEEALQRMEVMMQQLMETAEEQAADEGSSGHDSQEGENEMRQGYKQ